ncbi:hypothetical protein H8R18_08550 [Nanchangia anserum]|uniref:Protein kinase domain-containing protein n=1 Tax=Nanchangia anserum TaxID=2692125 RepID=A0A8I0GB61_9ACTO|nr:hypothetical protein [Nanchangia anserum]MBD3689563.1 hypothetical protein [Nanchangia anserum]QOX81748.1 hypothetical protein H8R18_08550 [Nanchangia anserum]
MTAEERLVAQLTPTERGVRAHPTGTAEAWWTLMTSLADSRIPGVQRVLEVEEGDSVVLEAATGQSLGDYVSDGLEAAEVERLLGQIAQALAGLHERGGAHGNLSTSSIRMSPEGAIVLLEDALTLDNSESAREDAMRLDGSACVELLYFLLTASSYEPGPLGTPSIPRSDGAPVPPSTLNPDAGVALDAVALTASELTYPSVCQAIAQQLAVPENSATDTAGDDAEETPESETTPDAPGSATAAENEDADGIHLPLPPATRHPLRSVDSASQGDDPAQITGAMSLSEARAELEAILRDTPPATLADDPAEEQEQAPVTEALDTRGSEGAEGVRIFDELDDVDADSADSEATDVARAVPASATPPLPPPPAVDAPVDGDDLPGATKALDEAAPAAEPPASAQEGDQASLETSQIPLVELENMHLDPTKPAPVAPAPARSRLRSRIARFFGYYFGAPVSTSILPPRQRRLVDPQRFILRASAIGMAVAFLLAIVVLAWPLPKPQAAATPTRTASPQASPTPQPEATVAPEIAEITIADPDGDGNEHPEMLANLTDGDASSAWYSRTYVSDTYGMKRGIGLVITLKETATVSDVTLTGSSTGGLVQIKTGTPEEAPDAPAAAEGPLQTPETTLHLDKPITVDRVIVWVPQLPTDTQTSKFRLALSGITVK